MQVGIEWNTVQYTLGTLTYIKNNNYEKKGHILKLVGKREIDHR